MAKEALIIFVRKPELGKVKTRLAAAVGNEKALSIYMDLLQHTHDIACGLQADKFVFYAGQIEHKDLWDEGIFAKELQDDADLGGKMKAAFSLLFNRGYSKIVIIGSDCFQLSSHIIETAFEALQNKDAVIGPATDGGYYLLGMKKPMAFIFDHKLWSTEKVFEQTTEDFHREKIAYSTLAMLTDVDTETDWLSTRIRK